jgi:hypothetical protein
MCQGLRTGGPAGCARDAGFADSEVLPIEDDFFRFYRLHP